MAAQQQSPFVAASRAGFIAMFSAVRFCCDVRRAEQIDDAAHGCGNDGARVGHRFDIAAPEPAVERHMSVTGG